jgi:hypothetical protein
VTAMCHVPRMSTVAMDDPCWDGRQEGVTPIAVAQGRADHVMEAVLSKADGARIGWKWV